VLRLFLVLYVGNDNKVTECKSLYVPSW